jgi:hypothetical protein
MRWALGSAVLAASVSAYAVPTLLAGQNPYTAALNGTQSDDGSPPAKTQAFTVTKTNAVVQSIVWWGFRTDADPQHAGFDDFTVAINGNALSGNLSEASEPDLNGLSKYTLDLDVDLSLGSQSGTLAISNFADSFFAWWWQGINGSDGSLPSFPVSYQLLGTGDDGTTVPEPGSLALVAMAGLALLASRRRSA